ncbi:MAG: aspartyl protease family protein [Gammaproteobacteria bacterium]
MRRLLFLIVLLMPGIALAAAPTAAQILAQSKAASGGTAWDHIHTLRSEGTIEVGGLSGSASELQDFLTGRSVSQGSLGSYRFAQGFDGKMGWSESPDGEVSPDDSPAAKMRDLTAAYQTEQAWWYPERWPAKIESLGTREDDGTTYQVLQITPQGGNPFEMWINDKTHLIARTVDRTGVLPETTYFSDYRTVDGVKMPFHQRVSNGKKQYDTAMQLKTASFNVPVADSDFAMPQQKLNDFSFVGGGNEATFPFKLINNHIYIPVNVNDHAFQFMLDTGGANILSPQAAEAAGVKSKGALEGGGVGKKSVNAGLARVTKLTLGSGVALRNQTFMVIPFPGFAEVEGARFDGLVGFEVFKRFVVRIDYADQKLTLIRPADFKPTDAGTPVPFVFVNGGRMPGVEGSIDGLPGLFEVDTGSRAALSLMAPFAKTNDLYSRYQATPETVVGWGVGGSASGRVARGGKLMIGTVAVNDPVIEMSMATKGAFADKHEAGNIGGEILKHFTVTFDYANQKMYLEPNKDYGAPMNYDHSGMWVNGTDGGFVVKSVMTGGPAEQAGLKAGDVITAVNGKPASGLGLSDLRAMLRNDAPGTRLTLSVSNGKQNHQVVLILRRLIPATGGLRKAA